VPELRSPSPWRGMRLRNFRAFEDTGWLHFAALTVIFGKNSSGKTTLLRAPLLVRQMLLSQAATGDVPLSGEDVDLGGYRDLVYKGELRRDVAMSFLFDWTNSRPPVFRPAFDVPELAPLLHQTVLDITLHWNARASRTQVKGIAFRASPEAKTPLIALERLGPGKTRLTVHPTGYRTNISDASELSLRTLPFMTSLAKRSGEQRDDPTLILFNLHARLREACDLLAHIGPLRSMPERAYRLDSIPSAGPSSHMVGIMASNENAVRAASTALQSAGMAAQVEVTRPAPGYLGIVLIDPKTKRKTNLADVGFGASQVLPIIVTLASVPERSLVLIQQPELHLHPHTQVKVADVIIELAKAANLGLIVESHSEHLLLRIQTRLALGDVEPSDFCLYFVDRSRVSRATANHDGVLDTSRLPADFFEEEWTEAVNLARAARRESKK
jgi:hypothetical protein